MCPHGSTIRPPHSKGEKINSALAETRTIMEPVHLKHKLMGILGGTKNEGLTNHNPHWTDQSILYSNVTTVII